MTGKYSSWKEDRKRRKIEERLFWKEIKAKRREKKLDNELLPLIPIKTEWPTVDLSPTIRPPNKTGE